MDQELVCIMVNYIVLEVINKSLYTRQISFFLLGYDILGSESITHGEYLTLRYPHENQWQYRPELSITRARPLVLIIPDNSINKQSVYAAGGYDVHRTTHKPYMIPDIQLFNPIKQQWEQLTIIPNLTLLHALSFNDNKLHVSETTDLPDQIPDTKILRSFDLKNLVWIEGDEIATKKKNLNIKDHAHPQVIQSFTD